MKENRIEKAILINNFKTTEQSLTVGNSHYRQKVCTARPDMTLKFKHGSTIGLHDIE